MQCVLLHGSYSSKESVKYGVPQGYVFRPILFSLFISDLPLHVKTSHQRPQWEHINAKFDTDYTDLKKSSSTNILTIEVREHLINSYQNHIKSFTDGSVLDSDSGAGFVIPELKVQKSFYLGNFFFNFFSPPYSHVSYMQY